MVEMTPPRREPGVRGEKREEEVLEVEWVEEASERWSEGWSVWVERRGGCFGAEVSSVSDIWE